MFNTGPFRTAGRRRTLALLAFLALSSARGATPAAEPELVSLYPAGGRLGSSFEATVRGTSLCGARAVWFRRPGLRGKVTGCETGLGEKGKSNKSRRVDLLRVSFVLDSGLQADSYEFRILTPWGVSNALQLHVHSEPFLLEGASPHDLPRQAQAIAELPAAVHGRIAEIGQVDYYSFRVQAGDEWTFRTYSSKALDPGLALYELTGSWFDPDRAKRLAFTDEPVAYPGLPTEALLRYRFPQTGRYLVRVNGFWGHGGPDQSYVLVIAPAGSRTEPPPLSSKGWEERTWTRTLGADRMGDLWSRAVPPPTGLEEVPAFDLDAEPKAAPVEPPTVPLPALLTGSIEHPGDVDRVRFSVDEGDRIVLEVETPEKTVPLMNPYLRVVDADGVEAFTNIYSRVNANGNISKQIQPKTQYAFPREGDFTLEIRDITASYGDAAMRYRVLLRSQVPHLGAIHVTEDRLNLTAGTARKLSVTTDQEEGFDGLALLTVEGLPEGVRSATATEVEPDRPPPFNEGKKERFTTKSKKATFVFLCEPDAPVTPEPVQARVFAQPIVEGKLGSRILAKELLIMVTRPEPDDQPVTRTEDTR